MKGIIWDHDIQLKSRHKNGNWSLNRKTEVATWNKGGKEKNWLQQRTEVTTRRKEIGTKRGRDITLRSRHKIETYEGRRPPTQSRPRNQSHNMKTTYKQKGGRNIKLLSQLISQKKRKTTMSRHETVVAT